MKPACANSVAVFVVRAFFAAGDQEHHEVEELAGEGFVAGRDDAFDDEQPAVRGHRAVAVAEDGERLFVFPVVDDVAHEVGVGAGGHGLEEAAGDEFAAIGEAGRGDI